MIDWVSIVRTSGQRFSNVLGTVPNKVRRKRRKRNMQEQEQMMQRQQMYQQLQAGGCGGVGLGGGPSSVSGIGPTCICELGSSIIDEDEVGSIVSGASCNSASISGSPAGHFLSTSPPSGSCSNNLLGTSPSHSTASNSSPGLRHNSLCEIHGKIVSFGIADELKKIMYEMKNEYSCLSVCLCAPFLLLSSFLGGT
jgi:hypothetical protein